MKQKKIHIPPESDRVEWKQSLGKWKEIVETCAAFATARGGTIYVGVAFDGTPNGVQIGKGTLEGNLLGQLEESLGFVRRNTRQAIRITGKPEREIVPEYPDEAVREALINALCHWDYASVGTVNREGASLVAAAQSRCYLSKQKINTLTETRVRNQRAVPRAIRS